LRLVLGRFARKIHSPSQVTPIMKQIDAEYRSFLRKYFWVFLLASLANGLLLCFLIRFHWLVGLTGTIMGLSLSLVMTYYSLVVHARIARRYALSVALLINGIAFMLIVYLIGGCFILILLMALDLDRIWDTLARSHQILLGGKFLLGTGFGFVITVGLSFLAAVDRLVGNKQLFSFLIGKYHRPVEEQRIFMFLDLNQSTRMAEELGNLQFIRLLADFFYDISAVICRYQGQVYKYVGDEVIVTWPLREGLRTGRCFLCFFALRDHLAERQSYYQKTYGLQPAFRGGIHGGPVVTGEVGYLKKEIAFVGDVVNTTARLLEACKSHPFPLLTTSDLVDQTGPNSGLSFHPLGALTLRGKQNLVSLYGVRKQEPPTAQH
jgi:adenylate cyclase